MEMKLEVIRTEELGPGDVVILRLAKDSTTTPEQAARSLERILSGTGAQAVIMTRGSRIRILRPKSSPNSPPSEDSSEETE